MSDGGYPVFQVQEPTKEDFYAALADAGLTWEYDDILERHQHPGMRVKEGTVALILHTVRFVRERRQHRCGAGGDGARADGRGRGPLARRWSR